MTKDIGKFIVIDGSDGAGKKTQSDLLIGNLKKQGHAVAFYDFPQYEETFFGKMVGRYLNGEFGEADDVSPYLASLLYAGDRWQAGEKMKEDLAAGKIVISNRYTQSNMGFQTAKFKTDKEKELFLSWITELEFSVYKIPKPDLVIYLYVPYQISQALVDQKDSRNYTELKRDIHEKNSDFLGRVEKTYLMLAKKYPEWEKIDCSSPNGILSIQAIGEKISKILRSRLGIK